MALRIFSDTCIKSISQHFDGNILYFLPKKYSKSTALSGSFSLPKKILNLRMLFNFDKVNDKKSLNLIIGGTLQINFRKTPFKFFIKTITQARQKNWFNFANIN